MENQKNDQPYASFETSRGNGSVKDTMKDMEDTERRALGMMADKAKSAAQKGKQAAVKVGQTIKSRPYLAGLILFIFGGAFLARFFMMRRG